MATPRSRSLRVPSRACQLACRFSAGITRTRCCSTSPSRWNGSAHGRRSPRRCHRWSPPMSEPVTTTVDDGVLVVRIDDGKMNALSHHVIEQLHAALDTATTDAQSVCLAGNERALSAGFDLTGMTAGPVAARELVEAGARLLMRLYAHPQPTVLAGEGG